MPPLSCAHGLVSWMSQNCPSADGTRVTAPRLAIAIAATTAARRPARRIRIREYYRLRVSLVRAVNIYVALLIGYSAALTALGLWIARKVRGPADFFVAGRKLTWPYIAATMLAANIGAGATVGATGLAYQQGVSAWFWNASAGIGSLILATLVGPRIWKLAAERNYLTVGDFLEDRYGQSVRVIIASLIWFGALFILAGQLLLGAAVFAVVAGLPKWAGVLIGGAAMTGYFSAGGLLELRRRQRRPTDREVHGLRDRDSDPDQRGRRARGDRAHARPAGHILRSVVLGGRRIPASRCCC